jgi:hypothetical protein
MNHTQVIGPAAVLLLSTVVHARRTPQATGIPSVAPTGPIIITPTDLCRLDDVSQSIVPDESQVRQLKAMTRQP